MGCNVSAAWRATKRGALMANPCFTQIHPTCIPVSGEYQSKLTLMSESLRNDGRVWVPKKLEDAKAIQEGRKTALDISEEDRDYYLERRYPHLVTSYQEMSLQEQPKWQQMKVKALLKQVLAFIWILQRPLNVMEKRRQ